MTTDISSSADVERILEAAAAAAEPCAAIRPRRRAEALGAIALALESHAEELLGLAMTETGLTRARLEGELRRTAVQLRLFAEVVREGGYLDVRIDAADPEFILGPRPDLRRYLVPVGPVVNFTASNFPFAFSVAGGDTAAALAAGCPVVVKAHSGHPRLSVRTAEIVADALHSSGMPAGAFSLISGQSSGVKALKDRRIRAGSFTGSIHAGRLLADIAAARPAPIPFFGELGSVNPVFITADALAEDAAAIASGLIGSVGGSAGQLCTKPGFVFLPRGHNLEAALGQAAAGVPEHRLLNPRIADSYRARRREILDAPGVRVPVPGSLRFDADGQGWATPTIVAVALADLSGSRLLDEVFGPMSILVEYGPEDDLAAAARSLFSGNLTATVHAGASERAGTMPDSAPVRALLGVLRRQVGRVLIGGWPTGVAVTPAMQHGGPWPATTNDSSTSVGSAAISRFLRPVAYQGAEDALLPEPLQTANPWGVPQTFAAAGESSGWGAPR